MNNQQAIQLLVDSAKVANKRGAFELNESAAIAQAVSFLESNSKLEQSKEEEKEKKPNKESKETK